MLNQNIYAVYFSPTGGTKKYVCAAAKMLADNFKEINLTDFDNRRHNFTFKESDIVIIGTPVYFGRVVQIEDGIFQRLTGNGAKAILFAVYGNRDYDDALLELKHIAVKNGFKPVAAAALIAPHTFCDKAAPGRPDKNDLKLLADFMQNVENKLKDDNLVNKDLYVKGNFPYKQYGNIPFYPIGNDSCTKCRACFQICPANAIEADNPKDTDPSKCISCMACVKVCPLHARGFHSLKSKIMLKMLERKLTKTVKQPEFFI